MVRISLVDYLNAAPLGWSFLHGPHQDQFEVLRSSPARCAAQLAGGEVDIGVIPSIEYQRIPDLRIIPGICIASTSRVRSVLMVKRKGIEVIRTVALDTSSRTSVALLTLLLQKQMGLNPEFVPHPPDIASMLRRCDAALLIGDAALKIRMEDYDTVDLAEAWMSWQHKPFVFAIWACRADASLPGNIVSTFLEARDWGLAARHEIARVYSRSLDLPHAYLMRYLFDNVDYTLGQSHIEGLQRFYQLAQESQLISEQKPLSFLSD